MKRKASTDNIDEKTKIKRETELYSEYNLERKKIERKENLIKSGEVEPKEPNKKENEKEEEILKPTTIAKRWNKEEEKEITYEVLRDHVMTRKMLYDNIYKPFFEHVKNTYVRVCFDNGYALCKIVDIWYGEEYKYDTGKTIYSADTYLDIQHGCDVLKIPIAIISNSKLTEEEFEAQLRYDLDLNDVVDNFVRVNKLFTRQMSKLETRTTDDERRKFIYPAIRRLAFFRTDLIRKRREVHLQGKKKLTEEMAEDYIFLNSQKNAKSSIEINRIGRKYDLRILCEIDAPEVTVKIEKGNRKNFWKKNI